MQAATALLRRAPVAARPPDQRVQAAVALRRRGPVYFFHASGANPIEKYLLDCMVVAGILHKQNASNFISTSTNSLISEQI